MSERSEHSEHSEHELSQPWLDGLLRTVGGLEKRE